MRIAIDVRPLASDPGGVRRYTTELVRALSRVDSQNEYALTGLPNHWSDDIGVGDNFKVYPARGGLTRVIDQVRLTSVPGPIDLFHGTNYAAPLSGAFPSVITVHDLSVVLFPETHPLRRRLRHRLLPRLCNRASRVIADSHSTKRDLVRCFDLPPDKIDVIYLAVGDDMRRVEDPSGLERVRRRYQLPDEFNLFLGSVEPRKNLDSLLRATAQLKDEGRTHRLVIAGKPETAYLNQVRRTMLRCGLAENEDVFILGPVDDEDLPALYSLARLFVYPSFYEGFGLPPLEAMACRTPVLVPDNSSLAEIYESCGCLFDLDDPEALVSAMRSLLDSPAQQAELAELGLKLALSRSWDDIAHDTLDVYERALINY